VPQRSKQHGHQQRGGGHGERGVAASGVEGLAEDHHGAGIEGPEHHGEQPIGQGAADEAVDVVEVVVQDRDGDRGREQEEEGCRGQQRSRKPCVGSVDEQARDDEAEQHDKEGQP
jgi:hypothetical protein